MASAEPREGKCNARLSENRGYCGNDPYNPTHPTNKRCKFHGGMSTPTARPGNAKNALKHGLYAQRLRTATGDEKLWDSIERNTSLENEIVLARSRVLKFQEMMAKGDVCILGPPTSDPNNRKCWMLEDLLDKALDQLGRLTQAQQRMHPEAGISGHMTLNVNIDVGTASVADQEVPDLDADGTPDKPAVVPTDMKTPAGVPVKQNPLDELD